MPPSKGLTRATRLRMTDAEKDLLTVAQGVYERNGVKLSQNDMIRHLIRRAGIVLAYTPEAAWAAISEHCQACEHCELNADGPRCPEGLYLFRHFKRLRKALTPHQGTEQAHAL